MLYWDCTVQCPALLDGKVMYYWHGIIVIVNNTIIILKFYRNLASRPDIEQAHLYIKFSSMESLKRDLTHPTRLGTLFGFPSTSIK